MLTSEAQRPAVAPVPLGRETKSESVAAAQVRDFTRLYEEHFGFVWRSVRYLGVPEAQTDDAVQDTFLVAHRRLADFEARSSPRTWLFAIALRVVRDHRRSLRRRGRLHDELGRVTPASTPTPFDHTAHGEKLAVLHAALEALPEDQRAVFVLTELEQLSAPEIAQALELNLNTVYSRLRAARRKFAEIVGGQDG